MKLAHTFRYHFAGPVGPAKLARLLDGVTTIDLFCNRIESEALRLFPGSTSKP